MLLILLEALLALVLLVLIVWWTMFSGRKKGEPIRDDSEE
jgi:cbb3-type cytochrome oxidase subunit 3